MFLIAYKTVETKVTASPNTLYVNVVTITISILASTILNKFYMINFTCNRNESTLIPRRTRFLLEIIIKSLHKYYKFQEFEFWLSTCPFFAYIYMRDFYKCEFPRKTPYKGKCCMHRNTNAIPTNSYASNENSFPRYNVQMWKRNPVYIVL